VLRVMIAKASTPVDGQAMMAPATQERRLSP
jgi:hypothetical protein